MKLGTKIAAGILLGIGLPISLFATTSVFNPKVPSEERDGAMAALLIFGVPPTALGGWLIWSGRQRSQAERRERLRATFFRLLIEGKGHLTVLRFAMETGLEGEAAKEYLNDRAREFNASYNVTEEGKFSYYFDLGELHIGSLPGTAAGTSSGIETFDVILESVPLNRRRQVVKEVRELMNLDWQQAKNLVKQLPEPVRLRQGVSKLTAEEYRNRLEAAGAEVLIVLN